MWKTKLGISLGNKYSIPTHEVVSLVKQIGFDAISPEWAEDTDLGIIVARAREIGLAVQSLHAPYYCTADLWSTEECKRLSALDIIMKSLEDCHKHEIPVLVMHTWIGFDNIPAPSAEGVKSYMAIAEKAKKYNIKLALENTEGLDHLEYLMEHFKGWDNVGFCWDSGHEMCYNYSQDLLSKFGDRLFMTHLNDNLGISRYDGTIYWTDDLHLFPYDGIADWDYNVKRLKSARQLEYLNFELSIRSKPNRFECAVYEKMTIEEYFTEAYKRACRVAYALQRC